MMLGIEPEATRPTDVPAEMSGLAVVAISAGGRDFGLYRVKHAEARTLVLDHGAISFPVGMHLDIEDYQYVPPKPASFTRRATVVENGGDGIRLAW
jgi:hypothetical protein